MTSEPVSACENVAPASIERSLEKQQTPRTRDLEPTLAFAGGKAFGDRWPTQALDIPADEHRSFIQGDRGLQVDTGTESRVLCAARRPSLRYIFVAEGVVTSARAPTPTPTSKSSWSPETIPPGG